jgi:hypothetical protein
MLRETAKKKCADDQNGNQADAEGYEDTQDAEEKAEVGLRDLHCRCVK